MASGLADHLFRAFEKIPDQRIERIPAPANRDVDGIVGVEEGPEHAAARASELGAGGKDRHALSGKDEAERRVNRLDPVRDRHADLMPPEQRRHNGVRWVLGRPGQTYQWAVLQLSHWHGR